MSEWLTSGGEGQAPRIELCLFFFSCFVCEQNEASKIMRQKFHVVSFYMLSMRKKFVVLQLLSFTFIDLKNNLSIHCFK